MDIRHFSSKKEKNPSPSLLEKKNQVIFSFILFCYFPPPFIPPYPLTPPLVQVHEFSFLAQSLHPSHPTPLQLSACSLRVCFYRVFFLLA